MNNPPKNDTPDKTLVECPFCGSSRIRVAEDHWRDGMLCGGEPFCSDCGAKVPRYWPKRVESSRDTWNRRAALSQHGGLVEAVTLAADYLCEGFIECERCGNEVPTSNTDAELTLRAALSNSPVVGEDALPDIGPDPMATGKARELAAAEDRLKQAYVKQQTGVPNQTALVWRADLGDVRHELLRLRALAECAKPTPTDTADRREAVAMRLWSSASGIDEGNLDPFAEPEMFEFWRERVDAIASLIAGPPEGFNEARQAWEGILDGMKRFGMESEAIETVDAYFARPGESA